LTDVQSSAEDNQHHLAMEPGCGKPWHSAWGSCTRTAGRHLTGKYPMDEQSSQEDQGRHAPRHQSWTPTSHENILANKCVPNVTEHCSWIKPKTTLLL